MTMGTLDQCAGPASQCKPPNSRPGRTLSVAIILTMTVQPLLYPPYWYAVVGIEYARARQH